MPSEPRPLQIHRWGEAPLAALDSKQAAYLRCYLDHLEATWVLEGPFYFDRDCLAECTAHCDQEILQTLTHPSAHS